MLFTSHSKSDPLNESIKRGSENMRCFHLCWTVGSWSQDLQRWLGWIEVLRNLFGLKIDDTHRILWSSYGWLRLLIIWFVWLIYVPKFLFVERYCKPSDLGVPHQHRQMRLWHLRFVTPNLEANQRSYPKIRSSRVADGGKVNRSQDHEKKAPMNSISHSISRPWKPVLQKWHQNW